MANYPEDLLYTKEHEWVRVSGKTAKVGITTFAVEQLGDVTQVDLPKEGESLKASEVFGSVESVKAVSDCFAPISGKVTGVNSTLKDSPEYVNEDPYEEGWMIELEIANPDELKGLMNADAYAQFVQEHAE